MKGLITIIVLGLFVTLLPQEKKTSKPQNIEALKTNTVNYDSILEDAKKSAEQIKKDREIIKLNEGYISNLDKKKKEIVKEITTDLKKIDSKPVVIEKESILVIHLDSVCVKRNSWVRRSVLRDAKCTQWKIDTIKSEIIK